MADRFSARCARAIRVSTAVTGALVLVAAPGEPAAHVTANPDQASADGWFRTALRVSHGCEGSPTVAVRVKIPDGVLSSSGALPPRHAALQQLSQIAYAAAGGPGFESFGEGFREL